MRAGRVMGQEDLLPFTSWHRAAAWTQRLRLRPRDRPQPSPAILRTW